MQANLGTSEGPPRASVEGPFIAVACAHYRLATACTENRFRRAALNVQHVTANIIEDERVHGAFRVSMVAKGGVQCHPEFDPALR
jgi:hypothetical protein